VDGSNSYWYLYDANGNVGQLIRATDQSIAARYEYDPYGNTIVKEGSYADANPFRFSTKWFDSETGMGYWGRRYLLFRIGRWANHDPAQEEGGLNLYAFTSNNPTNAVDPDGTTVVGLDGWVGWGRGEIQKMGRAIEEGANAILNSIREDAKRRGFLVREKEEVAILEGSDGKDMDKLGEQAAAYARRRYDGDGARCPMIEGFVVFGFSDGATTIYVFFNSGRARRALSRGPGEPYRVSFGQFIDMVHKSFPFDKGPPEAGQELRKEPPFESRRVPLKDESLMVDSMNFFQNADAFDILFLNWKGYIWIGDVTALPVSPTNHLQMIGLSDVHKAVVDGALQAYESHVLAQIYGAR
jgi:RHS repeat-associated protein